MKKQSPSHLPHPSTFSNLSVQSHHLALLRSSGQRTRGWGGVFLVQMWLFLLLSGHMTDNRGLPGATFGLLLASLCAHLLMCGMKVVEGMAGMEQMIV